MATKKSTKKKSRPEQTKIPGTGRTDAIPEVDEAGEAYREKRDARMEMQEEESDAQDYLTAVLKKHGKSEYTYEGADGKLYKASIAEAKAKVKRVTQPKAPKQS